MTRQLAVEDTVLTSPSTLPPACDHFLRSHSCPDVELYLPTEPLSGHDFQPTWMAAFGQAETPCP